MGRLKFILSVFLSLLLVSVVFSADKYTLDKPHSSASFKVKHMVVSSTTGRFRDMDATFEIDESDLTKSSATVTIKTASITTENERRDGHLKSPDFFDVEKYPEITFKSTKVEKTDDGYMMSGNLTIKDVTKEISFPFEFNGFVNVGDSRKFGADASLTINRQDYNVNWSKSLDNGGLVAGDEVMIDLHVEGNKETGTN